VLRRQQKAAARKFVLLFFSSSSSVASILMERGRVCDAAPGDAVMSTPPGRVEAKVLRSKVLLFSPQSGGSWSAWFQFLVETNA